MKIKFVMMVVVVIAVLPGILHSIPHRTSTPTFYNFTLNASLIQDDTKTKFNCTGLPYGYYTDEANSCTVFNACLQYNISDKITFHFFKGGEGTAFDQESLVCVFQEAESQNNQLFKDKLSINIQLEDQRQLADDESRERATLLGKYRNPEHDIDGLREQLEEESESKASADAQMWRSKYETEGIARVEELEAARMKLAARLEEAEDQIEQLNMKNLNLEKTKQRIAAELEDMQIEVERAQALVNAAEKKQKNFDRIISEWKMKVDDLTAELDASHKQYHNYASEHFRIKVAYEENLEQLDAVRRENKNLSDEIKDLMDQIGEGGRTLHEVQKTAKRLETEKKELQAALEEAEAALEQEENKVLRAQLEFSQVRQEIDRRIQKEEEFENTRKRNQRAIESMQTSLEAEAKAKSQALRLNRKLENTNADLQEQIKKQIDDIKYLQIRVDEEQSIVSEYRDQFAIAERRADALDIELEKVRTFLEQSHRNPPWPKEGRE